jgi:hypothetical protein
MAQRYRRNVELQPQVSWKGLNALVVHYIKEPDPAHVLAFDRTFPFISSHISLGRLAHLYKDKGRKTRLKASQQIADLASKRDSEGLYLFLGSSRGEPLTEEEVIETLSLLPRWVFFENDTKKELVNLTPHPIQFVEYIEENEEIVDLHQSGAYVRTTEPKYWSGKELIPFDRRTQYWGPLKVMTQQPRRERDKLYLYIGDPIIPQTRINWLRWGYFPSPTIIRRVFPNTYFFVSARSECIEPYYESFVMPYKRTKRGVISAFQSSDGVCHVPT